MSMKGESIDEWSLFVLLARAIISFELGEIDRSLPAVNRVHSQGMLDGGKMHANLVEPPGVRTTFEQRVTGQSLRYAIGGERWFAIGLIDHRATAIAILADGQFNLAIRHDSSLYDGQIDFFHLARGEALGETPLCGKRSREDKNAACVAVEAVDGAKRFVGGNVAATAQQVRHAGIAPPARNREYAGWFVDDENGGVEVKNDRFDVAFHGACSEAFTGKSSERSFSVI